MGRELIQPVLGGYSGQPASAPPFCSCLNLVCISGDCMGRVKAQSAPRRPTSGPSENLASCIHRQAVQVPGQPLHLVVSRGPASAQGSHPQRPRDISPHASPVLVSLGYGCACCPPT